MFLVITVDDPEKWDSIVKSFKNYDVCYLSGYAKAFRLHGEGEPVLFYFDNGSTKAINVVMKRDISEIEPFIGKLPAKTWYDISTPYGYGGLWVEGGDYESVNDAYDEFCKEQNFVSEFVRFHLLSDYIPHYRGTVETHTHNVIRTLDLPVGELLMDFEHKVRKNIKRANAVGLTIEIDAVGERLDDFLRIYYETMNRTGAAERYSFSRQFFEGIHELKEHFVYFHVLSGGRVIATELVLYGSGNCYSFLGGTDNDYFPMRPNDYLKFEIIKWAKDKGLKRFILGGGCGGDDGIFRYKKSFAPDGICSFYIGKRIFDKTKYELLTGMRPDAAGFYPQNEPDGLGGFFPGYRRGLTDTVSETEHNDRPEEENE